MRPFEIDKDIETEIKESMILPYTPRPKIETHPGHRPGYDRRSKRILMRVRRLWWHMGDSIGLFLWAIVGLIVAIMAWGTFIGFEKWAR